MENDPIVEFEEIMELLRQLVNNDSRIIPLTAARDNFSDT